MTMERGFLFINWKCFLQNYFLSCLANILFCNIPISTVCPCSFCKYDCKPKCILCFEQVAIPFVLVSCAFEAVQVTTQLSSKRYTTYCISALVRVSNLFWKNSEFSNLNVKFKKPIRSHFCFYLFLGRGVLFSDFCRLRGCFCLVINEYKLKCCSQIFNVLHC